MTYDPNAAVGPTSDANADGWPDADANSATEYQDAEVTDADFDADADDVGGGWAVDDTDEAEYRITVSLPNGSFSRHVVTTSTPPLKGETFEYVEMVTCVGQVHRVERVVPVVATTPATTSLGTVEEGESFDEVLSGDRRAEVTDAEAVSGVEYENVPELARVEVPSTSDDVRTFDTVDAPDDVADASDAEEVPGAYETPEVPGAQTPEVPGAYETPVVTGGRIPANPVSDNPRTDNA